MNGIKNKSLTMPTLMPKYFESPAHTPPMILLSISLNNLFLTPPTSLSDELGTAIHKIR